VYFLVVGEHYPTPKYPILGIFPADQARALHNAGYPVIYAAVDIRSYRRKRKFGITYEIKDGMEIYSISWPVGAIPRNIKLGLAGLAFERLYTRIVKDKGAAPLLIHSHFIDSSVAVYKTAIKYKIPFFVTEHSSSLNKEELNPQIAKDASEVYSTATRLITVSSALANRIKQHLGFDSIVIPNIVDLSIFHYQERQSISENFNFVSTGHLAYGKGHDILLKAFKLHLKTYPTSRLIIFGAGEEQNNLEKLAQNLEINNIVDFRLLQPREILAETYNKCEAFVLLSRGETFGASYIEAMASGLPVIATRCGGPEDFVIPETGLLVAMDQVNEAATALTTLRDDFTNYDRQAIANYARQNFSASAVANRVVEVYQEAIPDLEKKLGKQKSK